jgi:hypothetical protein
VGKEKVIEMEILACSTLSAILLQATNMWHDQRKGNLNLLGMIFFPQPMGTAVLFA